MIEAMESSIYGTDVLEPHLQWDVQRQAIPELVIPGPGGTRHLNIQQMAQSTRWAERAAPRFPKE